MNKKITDNHHRRSNFFCRLNTETQPTLKDHWLSLRDDIDKLKGSVKMMNTSNENDQDTFNPLWCYLNEAALGCTLQSNGIQIKVKPELTLLRAKQMITACFEFKDLTNSSFMKKLDSLVIRAGDLQKHFDSRVESENSEGFEMSVATDYFRMST